MTRKRWSDLSPGQRRAAMAAAAAQFALEGAAWADLFRRPRTTVNGPKAVWAAVIAINFAGPLAYFRWGHRPADGSTGSVSAHQPDTRSPLAQRMT